MKKISSKKSLLATVGAFALPFVALAQTGGSSDGIRHLLGIAAGIIQALIPIVIGLAVLVFLWGVLQYVLRSSDAGKDEGRNFMLWGIIALFVMVSVWGLVNILRDSLGLNLATPTAPRIPEVGQ
jgi:hypothetical protein